VVRCGELASVSDEPTTIEGSTAVADGRRVSWADFGPTAATPVLWCHGGAGNRYEAAGLAPAASDAGFRIIGFDRPGYGGSDPFPGRTIADLVPDMLSIADALDVDRFVAVGVSTGASYSMAVAAMAPDRVSHAVSCCGVTDMRLGRRHGNGPRPGTVVPANFAPHTASIVPGAQLTIVPELGHFSIAAEVVPALAELVASSPHEA
jgi:pimeloyl-ACP methyl ester carboxylesterase